MWKYLRLQQFLAIPFWNANRTFNSHHHLFQEKTEQTLGKEEEERKVEAVVLQYAENKSRAS